MTMPTGRTIETVEYFHPDAEELLRDTYGLMIYQESVMRLPEIAGYTSHKPTISKGNGQKYVLPWRKSESFTGHGKYGI